MFSYPQRTLVKSILTTLKFCELEVNVINLSSHGTFHQNIFQSTKSDYIFKNILTKNKSGKTFADFINTIKARN